MGQTKLSEHFSLEELYYSTTAIRKGIDNYPPEDVIANLTTLCKTILEPIRALVKKPVKITSGYRRLLLNSIVGGSMNSQHIQGKAADIHVNGMSIEDLYLLIKDSKIPYGQCIQEFSGWVHVSHSDNPRRESLRATKVDGKTIYTPDE